MPSSNIKSHVYKHISKRSSQETLVAKPESDPGYFNHIEELFDIRAPRYLGNDEPSDDEDFGEKLKQLREQNKMRKMAANSIASSSDEALSSSSDDDGKNKNEDEKSSASKKQKNPLKSFKKILRIS
ncbi:hypothetical protein G9A89_004505 [Geosiphon pyriformis]|nr:hypothetical protein G9A89_004505 [Geosiphon pyriformis]